MNQDKPLFIAFSLFSYQSVIIILIFFNKFSLMKGFYILNFNGSKTFCISSYQKLNISLITQMSQTNALTSSLPGRLAFLVISLLFVDQFGRSLQFCYPEFDKEAISDVLWHSLFLGGGAEFQRAELLWSLRTLFFCFNLKLYKKYQDLFGICVCQHWCYLNLKNDGKDGSLLSRKETYQSQENVTKLFYVRNFLRDLS